MESATKARMPRSKAFPLKVLYVTRDNFVYLPPRTDKCNVCLGESTWRDWILVCQSCQVAVHKNCYNAGNVPREDWSCDRCLKNLKPSEASCKLCPYKRGAMKSVNRSKALAHVLCAKHISGVEIFPKCISVKNMPPSRVCIFCKAMNRLDTIHYGGQMNCNAPGCRKHFHVTCAKEAGMLRPVPDQFGKNSYVGYCHHHKPKGPQVLCATTFVI